MPASSPDASSVPFTDIQARVANSWDHDDVRRLPGFPPLSADEWRQFLQTRRAIVALGNRAELGEILKVCGVLIDEAPFHADFAVEEDTFGGNPSLPEGVGHIAACSNVVEIQQKLADALKRLFPSS